MARYLILWEIDESRTPIDPKERGNAWGVLLEMVKNDIKKGITKDWGSFVGENGGFAVFEGTEVEVELALQQYVPYVTFQTHAVGTVDHVSEVIKALTG
jgi:hypothetical protein